MPEQLSLQSPLAKWFAVASSLAIGALSLVSGAALLFAQKMSSDLDTDLPRAFELVSSFGLSGVFLAWLIQMVAMLLLLGYTHTENRTAVILVLAGASFLYLLYTLAASLFIFSGWGGTVM